jgi:muscarinic acetylcholine receptor M3
MLLNISNSNATDVDASSTEYWSVISFSLWKIFFSIVSFVVCFLTASGNVLVLYSFKVNKKLRTTNNYFLISLAIADAVIGFVSMPLATIYFLTEKWLLGPYICDLWLCIDYTVSNASAANLLLISFDRYFSITRPLTYRANRTTKKVTILIAISWLISMLLWTPFIIIYNSWPYIQGERSQNETECKVQFLNTNKYLTLGTACAAFYIPVTVICIVYFKIWRKTKKRHVELRKLMQTESYPKTKSEKFSNIKKIRDDIRNYDKIKNKHSIKTFLNNLVDKEEEEDNDLNENSTISNDSNNNLNNNNNFNNAHLKSEYSHVISSEYQQTLGVTTNLDDISHEDKQQQKTKYNFENNEDQQSQYGNRDILTEKWYTRILNTHSNCCISFLFSRIFKRHAHCSGSGDNEPVDYSKCKIYYKSSAARTKEVPPNSSCRHCQNEFSFYTIVIQLNNYNNNVTSTNKTNNKNNDNNNRKKSVSGSQNEEKDSCQSKTNVIIKEYPDENLVANDDLNAENQDVLLKNEILQRKCSCNCKDLLQTYQRNDLKQNLPKIESSIELNNFEKLESIFFSSSNTDNFLLWLRKSGR